MIDTDKYEGHEEGHQAWQELVKDAPLLLEEVKRLRGIIDNREWTIKLCDEEVKRLREKNRSLFLQLSKVQGQLNAIHRGEEE